MVAVDSKLVVGSGMAVFEDDESADEAVSDAGRLRKNAGTT